MKNSVLEVDPKRYGRLLARKLPGVIRSEEENERLIAEPQWSPQIRPMVVTPDPANGTPAFRRHRHLP